MAKEKKQRVRTSKYKIINIVLYPSEEQQSENYVKVLSQIHSTHHEVKVGTDRYFLILKFDKTDDYYKGQFCSYVKIDPDSKAFDQITKEIVNSDTDPEKGYGVKIWDYWFFPKYHRLIFHASSSQYQIFRFLNESIKNYFNGDDNSFAINIEKDASTINNIYSAKIISSIEISLSYSNNDNNDGWEKLIDDQMRKANVTKSTLDFKGSYKTPLKLEKDTLLSGALSLSKSNGTAKAHIVNKDGRAEIINTEQHPQIVPITHIGEEVDGKLKQLAHDISSNYQE